MESLNILFEKLWQDYAAMNKQAGVIHNALEKRGEKVINDHVAFRTFDLPGIGIDSLAEPFLKLGYEVQGEPYVFTQKKLVARYFEHPAPGSPKVFISALKVEELSESTQKIITELLEQIPEAFNKKQDFLISGASWKPITHQAYQQLLIESEYAAWMAAFGFRVNHFTVYFNALNSFETLAELNEFVKNLGYALNVSGGEIKGGPNVFLEQSSTLAHQVDVQFSDCKKTIPGCYYEFARRYETKEGKLFPGFVTQSADKIFESTNRQDLEDC